MKKKSQILLEITIGLLISAFVSWSYFTKSTKPGMVNTASLQFYDLLLNNLRESPSKSNIIKIIEIDEASVSTLGRWPWPRSLSAALIDEVFDYGAKVIGANILFVDADQNEALDELSRLQESFTAILNDHKKKFKANKIKSTPFEDFLYDLEETRIGLDGDSILERSLNEAGNAIIQMFFVTGEPNGENPPALPDYFESQKIQMPQGLETAPNSKTAIAATIPIERFGKAVTAIGHSNIFLDEDGVLRRLSPAIRFGDSFYPSFGLQLIRAYKDLPDNALTWSSDQKFHMGAFDIPVDLDGQTLLEYSGEPESFERFSALDILSRGIPEDKLKGKIVLIGLTAPGLDKSFVGPTGHLYTDLEVWASHMDNIFSQRFIKTPPWAPQAEWGMIGLSVLIVLGLLPFLRGKFTIPLVILVLGGFIGASVFFFVKQGLWISPIFASILLFSGFIIMTGMNLLLTEKGKELVEAEGVETNKMLGLSFQGQGILDMAFEKFRKCPVDKQMKDLLYNLALDMERKRMFAKAAAVHEHIFEVDPKFKDIQEKIKLLKKAGEGAVFGSLGKKGSDSTVVVEGLGQNTTLGRYEVEKELGRGAMGIVYLGKDPKINRQVAIKTLRFEDEVDEEQAKSIKERFFREAESAGNLTHPNIIRIFDAGEDQDVAYIAMELIEGEDLKKYCEKDKLLPADKVVEYLTHVAEGLSYAHSQGVIHRDIKPANIMLLHDGTLRITDFGIARIQASSKTATGAVLGTPAYMSPEQVNGKKADGRSDIFSLGVTLFEMLTGEKPFHADSIAALLYRIANVPHSDPREYNAQIPEALVAIINKALDKDPEKRYSTANEMAKDMKDYLKYHSASAPIQESAPSPFKSIAATESVNLEKKSSPAPEILKSEPTLESKSIPEPGFEPLIKKVDDLDVAEGIKPKAKLHDEVGINIPEKKIHRPQEKELEIEHFQSTKTPPPETPLDENSMDFLSDLGGVLGMPDKETEKQKPIISSTLVEEFFGSKNTPEDSHSDEKTISLDAGFEHTFNPPDFQAPDTSDTKDKPDSSVEPEEKAGS